MESNVLRFSVISRTPNSKEENCAPLTPYQPVSVIKQPPKTRSESMKRSKDLPKHIIVVKGKPVAFRCTVCSTTFKSRSTCCYHRHCGNEGEKPFTCSICDRKFSSKTHFTYHNLMHSGVNPFKCSECEKSFKTKHKLRRHAEVHKSMQKRFSCDICGRAFLRKSSVRVHKQVHTGEKPFQCNECSKTFREKKYLIFHLSHHHTKIRNWVCEICGKSYSVKVYLDQHKQTHSRQRPFLCTVNKCQQAFSQKRYLKRHMETHENCVKFICRVCEREFSRKDNLRRHIVNTHLESQNSNASKAEKLKNLIPDTAYYMKTTKMPDAIMKPENVVLDEQNVSTIRSKSVIMSATRTHGVISFCSRQEESTPTCKRISVIQKVANILNSDENECINRNLEVNHRDHEQCGNNDADEEPLNEKCVELNENSHTTLPSGNSEPVAHLSRSRRDEECFANDETRYVADLRNMYPYPSVSEDDQHQSLNAYQQCVNHYVGPVESHQNDYTVEYSYSSRYGESNTTFLESNLRLKQSRVQGDHAENYDELSEPENQVPRPVANVDYDQFTHSFYNEGEEYSRGSILLDLSQRRKSTEINS